MKIKRILPLAIIIILLCGIIYKVHSRIVILPQGDTYKLLEEKYGDEFPNILTFNSIKIGDKDILYLDMYKDKDYDLSFLQGTTKQEKLNSIISYVNKIPYSEYQNNPNLSSQGLNCQGYSLMIRDMCRQIGIPCTIVHTTNHMYNIVDLDGSKYKLDVVNGTMEEIKNK